MNRRTYLGAMLSTAFLRANAQERKVPRLGVLLFNSPSTEPIGPLLQGLDAMGYVDGKTISIEYRFAEGKAERLGDLAGELVQLKSPNSPRATGSLSQAAGESGRRTARC